ncbi:F-box/kelch-repeat protein At3g23880-like [Coffea arabica]|uniref:F-box/kelch-repeat protein At3g23880-like n=1 Tax=Coffea arabica TaxID=13443 RepID=A0ABM4VC07_COFAR
MEILGRQIPSSSIQDFDQPSKLADLPFDVITAILTMLPMKALLIFKCVSKLWLSLISGPKFIKDHPKLSASTSNTQSLLFVVANSACDHLEHCPLKSLSYEKLLYSVKIDYPSLNGWIGAIKVRGGCDGLLCIDIEKRGDMVRTSPSHS